MKNKKLKIQKDQLVIYQGKSGAIEFRGDFKRETIWATQEQIVELFVVDQSVVSRHIKNIFADKEIDPKSNMQKMHIANSDKPVTFYSLDIILSVGYRTNSGMAINFRRWATKTLKQHLLQGYTINKKRIGQNYEKFMQAVADVRALLPTGNNVKTEDILELIRAFAGTWFSLDAYDKDSLPRKGASQRQVAFTTEELNEVLKKLKEDLIYKKQATDIFGRERDKDAVGGIIGNVFQSFNKRDVYLTAEEKATHLLYFMVKNHPFIDGNKRSGALAFIWFLRKAEILRASLTPEALTALTLLVAESNPKDKNKMVGLVLLLLKK